MPACATDGPTAASNFDPGTEMISDPGNQSEQFDVSAFRAMLEQKSEKTSEKVVVNLDDHYRQQRDKKRQDLKNKSEAETYRRSYHARKISKSAESLNELDDDSNVDCKSSVSLSIGKRDETDILADERYGGVQPANPNLEEQSNTKHETNALNDEEKA